MHWTERKRIDDVSIYVCYPQGKTKALTMSYDDGRAQDERLIQIFNRNGIKGTFNLCSGWLAEDYPDEEVRRKRVQELYAGHEIATHTLTHPTMERIPLHNVAQEILEDRKNLEKLCGYPVTGHAYPNGSYTEDIKSLLRSLGMSYARVVPSSYSMDMPGDWYQWYPTCHHSDPRLMELAATLAEFEKKQYLKLLYVWGHSYEFDRDNNWQVIEEFCDFIGNRSDIWYAANGEIVSYLNDSQRLQFAVDNSFVYNPSAQSIWINVDGDIREIKGGTQCTLRN